MALSLGLRGWMAAFAWISVLGASGGLAPAARAQVLPGYTLQETVLVPVNGSAVLSRTALLSGVTYKLRAMGTATVSVPLFPTGGFQQADAEYGFGQPWILFGPDNLDSCSTSAGSVNVGIAVNNTTTNSPSKAPAWGPYNDEHIYTANFTGLGSPLTLDYHACSFGGARGLLTVQIFRPLGTNLPAGAAFTDVSPQLDTFAAAIGHSVSGRAHALAVAADGQRLYAGTYAGIWRSDDGGQSWRQMTWPQPAQGVDTVPGALAAPDVYDIAISPANPDVVIASLATDAQQPLVGGVIVGVSGIYRSTDGGVSWTLAQNFNCSNLRGAPETVFAPDDANLVYAAGGCAVGISHDGGASWTQVSMATQDAAWHIAVGPFEPLQNDPQSAAGRLDLMGMTPPRSAARPDLVGAPPPPGVRRVYALGTTQLRYSTDGGQTWTQDPGVNTALGSLYFGPPPAQATGVSSHILVVEPGNSQHVLMAVEKGANGPSFYADGQCGDDLAPDGSLCNAAGGRSCGEGSLWLGDFSAVVAGDPSHAAAAWRQLPGPPDYYGGSTDSGNVYVYVAPLGSSYLLFFSDRSHVHVSAGLPVAGGWHRVEGLDASQTAPPNPPNPICNNLNVHVDPHAVALSPGLSLTLQPSTAAAPFNLNKVEGPNPTGEVWLANDGGVYRASAAMAQWSPSRGLTTLATINLAGLAVAGLAPALYFGTGDNDDFYSLDGGAAWGDPNPDRYCGDCDSWYADPAQVKEVMAFAGRAGYGFLVSTNTTRYPTPVPGAPDGTVTTHWPCPADCNAFAEYALRGYRPLVLTLASETAPASDDYLVIGTMVKGQRSVFRKTNALAITSSTEWEGNPAKAGPYGPPLPACGSGAPQDCMTVVQASGGHAAPVLCVGDPSATPEETPSWSHDHTLWRWAPGMSAWTKIVPSATATMARRFFVDPYDPNVIYLVDAAAVKRSDDGGQTWSVDTSLDDAITQHHQYAYEAGTGVVLKDMVFTRDEGATRFAVGDAGVFYTVDGTNWLRLMSSTALPGHPASAYFDKISDPCDRALYVAVDGRGVVRIDPIPVRQGVKGAPPQLCNDGVKSGSAPAPGELDANDAGHGKSGGAAAGTRPAAQRSGL